MAGNANSVITDKSPVELGTALSYPPKQLRVDLEDGRTALIEITGNRARVDVRLDRHRVFGVNGDVAKLLLVLNEKGLRVDDEVPDWIEPILQRIGLEGIGE